MSRLNGLIHRLSRLYDHVCMGHSYTKLNERNGQQLHIKERANYFRANMNALDTSFYLLDYY